jgi:hypothetical protein
VVLSVSLFAAASCPPSPRPFTAIGTAPGNDLSKPNAETIVDLLFGDVTGVGPAARRAPKSPPTQHDFYKAVKKDI